MAVRVAGLDRLGMDILSFVPAFGSLVVAPIALALAIRALAGDPADDAVPTIATPFVADAPVRTGPVVPEVEFVPFRLDRAPVADRQPAGRPSRVLVHPVVAAH